LNVSDHAGDAAARDPIGHRAEANSIRDFGHDSARGGVFLGSIRSVAGRADGEGTGMSTGAATVVGAVVGLALGIIVSVTTDVPLAPEVGLALGALFGWFSRQGGE
jgi:hypothetical protein